MPQKEEFADDDMAAVGRATMAAIKSCAPPGWAPSNCPSEIVCDLRNQRDELYKEVQRLRVVRDIPPAPCAGEIGYLPPRQCLSEPEREASLLRELLARIHCDGGHYVDQHGLQIAFDDADDKIVKWLALSA